MVGHKIGSSLCRTTNAVFAVASQLLSAYMNKYKYKSLFAGCRTDVANDLDSRLARPPQTLHQRCKFCCFASGSMRHSHKSNSHPLTSRMPAPVSWELLLRLQQKGFCRVDYFFVAGIPVCCCNSPGSACPCQISMILDCVQIYYTVENCRRKLPLVVLRYFKVRLMQLIVSYRWALPTLVVVVRCLHFPVRSLRIYGGAACEDGSVWQSSAVRNIILRKRVNDA